MPDSVLIPAPVNTTACRLASSSPFSRSMAESSLLTGGLHDGRPLGEVQQPHGAGIEANCRHPHPREPPECRPGLGALSWRLARFSLRQDVAAIDLFGLAEQRESTQDLLDLVLGAAALGEAA